MCSTRPLIVATLMITVLATAGCSEDGDSDPQAALNAAAELLDEATSVRFTLEGDDLPDAGTVVVSAEGVAAPPASFEGEFRIRAGALPATIDVVSVDGQLWAQLPLTNDYELVDPDDLEVGDPGKLLDPDDGVSQLLRSGSDVTSAGQVRVDGEVYDQVESTLPGELVASILAIVDPTADVRATWALDPDTGYVHQANLTGPFYDGGEQTYAVHLDDYDEPVEISAPT